jgi:CHAT domain-containing protein
MVIKRSKFFRRVQRLLKQVQAIAHRQVTLLILLAMFLGAAVLPSFAHMAAETSIVQGATNAQELVEQGRILYEAERFNDAASVLQQAADVSEAQRDGLKQAITLSNLSLAHQQLGQWQKAEQAITQSLNILQTGQNLGTSTEQLQIFAQVLDVQGRLQLARGQAEPALKTWQRAESVYAQVDDEAALTRSRINQAQALRAMGLYLQAHKILAQLEQTLQNQPNSPLKATGLRSLGNVLRVVGDLSKSRQALEQSLTVAQAIQSPQAVSDALLELGNTARVQHDTQAALTYYQQAAARSTSPSKGIQAQLNQLSLLLETKQLSATQALWPQIQTQIANLPPSRMAVYARINFADARINFDQTLTRLRENTTTDTPSWLEIAKVLSTGVQQAKNLADQRAESYALGTLGGLYEQTKQLSSAQELTQQALLIAQAIDAPDISYQWQWQLGRLLKTQGNIQQALAAYNEAFKTLQSLRSDLVAINSDVQFSFRENVEPVYREFVDLLLRSVGDSPSGRVGNSEPSQENLKQARNVIESLQLAELDNFFREACLVARVEIDNVVDRENSTAAVFYPIILDDRLEIIVKLPKQEELRHYRTPIAEDKVESTLANLREFLLDVTRTSQVKEQSQQLYDWLIRPAEVELANSGIKTLVFILDGSLRNIPMAVLYDQQQKKYLVEKYAIALTPGLQLIDPKPLQPRHLDLLTAGVSEKRQVEGREFAPLKNVVRELQRIQSEVPKSEELFNQAFTQTNLQNQLQSAPFSVVHLATHGEFSSNAEETFILAWDTLLKVKDLDNLLRQSDQNRSSPIELLVLSACKTAEGDKRAALGLAGVAVRAGARSTLATLWSVDDESTTELMSQFYRELKTGTTKAEALQRAQLAVFANEKRPYFWSPYVMVGNWL